MPNDWNWVLDAIDADLTPDPKKIAALLKALASEGALVLPGPVAELIAGYLDQSLKRSRGPAKKVTDPKERTADIVIIEEFWGFKKALGSSSKAYSALGNQYGIDEIAAKQRYNRARRREDKRIPDRMKP